MPLHDANVGVGRPFMEAPGIVRRDESSSSWTVNVPTSSIDDRGKGISEDGYETGSDLDVDEVRILSEGFTRV